MVSLVAIAATLALPNLKNLIYNGYRKDQVNAMYASLRFARAQAVGLRTDITICKSNTGSSCNNALSWEDGWILFEDAGVTPGVVDTGERVLRYFQKLKGTQVTLKGDANIVDRVTFSSYGFANGFDGSFVWCDDRGFGVDSRVLIVSTQGTVRIEPGNDLSVTVASCTP